MPDLKITQLIADTTPQGTDLLTSVKSPFGSGSNRKITIADFMQNQTIDWKTTGHFSFGNTTFVDPAFPFQIGEIFIPVSGSSVFGFGFLSYYPDIQPTTDFNGPTDGVTFFDFESLILNTNKNLGLISNFYNYIEIGGSGTVDEVICTQYGSIITGTRNVNENYCLTIQSGHFGTGGTITTDKTFDITSPAYGLGGTMTTHIGINIEDQEFGTNSWSILTKGGTVQFGAPSGKNSLLYFQDADVAHGRTSIQPTDVYLKITSLSSTAGGVLMVGISDTDAQPFKVGAYFGTTNPTDAIPAFSVDVGKADGGTGITAIGNAETAFEVTNNGSDIFHILGNGNTTITGSITSAGLSESGLITWISGTAITAGSYQIGRDTDATNQLHFNVPTGASYEFSINDVAKMLLASDGSLSVAGAGANSEKFGLSSLAAGTSSLAIGNSASAADTNSIAIGKSASIASGGSNTILIGQGISTSSADGVTIGNGATNWKQSVGVGSGVNAGGQDSVGVGYTAGGGTQTVMLGSKSGGSGTNNIGIGYNVSVTGSGGASDSIGIGANAVTGFTNVIAIGSSATATAANQALIGGASTSITSVYFGKGVTSATPVAVTLTSTGGSTTGVNGSDIIIAGGLGGAAADVGGNIFLKTAPSGSGTTLTTRVTIAPSGTVTFTGTNPTSGSGTGIAITPTLAIMNGNDNYDALKISITNANHTGTGNTIQGITIDGITFDAQETAAAIIVGSGGWNYGLVLPSNIGQLLGTIGGNRGEIVFDGTNLTFSGTGGNIMSNFLEIDNNVRIGSSTADATATNTLMIFNGTAPTGVTDTFQMYSNDIIAGNAAPHFKTENGDVIKLFKSSAYTITNVTTDRSYDANSTTLDEIADVLGTLIGDLQTTGLIG